MKQQVRILKTLQHLIIISSFMIIYGCSSMPSASSYLDGEYSNYIKEAEGKTNNAQSLGMLCRSYFEIRNFKSFDQCAQSWMKDFGDTPMEESYGGPVFVFDQYSVALHSMYASFYIDMRKYEQALAEAEKSLQYWQAQKSWPLTYRWSGDLPDALLRSYQAIALSSIKLSRDSEVQNAINEINALNIVDIKNTKGAKARNYTLATIYIALNDYPKAAEMLERYDGRDPIYRILSAVQSLGVQEALDSTIEALTDNPYKIYMQGKLAYELKNTDVAKERLTKFVSLVEENNLGLYSLYPSALHDLANMHLEANQQTEAENLLRKAIEVLESVRSSLHSEATKIGFFDDKQQIYASLIKLLLNNKEAANAFEYIERSKARALVDMLSSKNFSLRTDNQALAQTWQSLNLGDASIAIQAPTSKQVSDDIVRSLKRKRKELKQAAPEFSSLVSVSIPPLDQLLQKLEADEQLVEYYYHNEELYAFVMSANNIKSIQLNGKNLLQDIWSFRSSMLDPHSNKFKIHSQDLYARLLKPLEPYLSSTRLTIVPHGVLHHLPFNALLDDYKYAIEKFTLRTLPSASVLTYLLDHPSQDSTLILGNPDLGDPDKDLPGAQSEAFSLAQQLSKQTSENILLLRERASETSFKNLAPAAGRLHIASHGEFNPKAPLHSRLLLAKDSQNDGHLTVAEIYDIRINADLVVMSACESGLGALNSGDDIVGLNRGFLFAGARSIISSQWIVDDKATKLFMEKLYNSLEQNDKATSIRQAQLWVKENYKAHPFYWAAFQLAGRW